MLLLVFAKGSDYAFFFPHHILKLMVETHEFGCLLVTKSVALGVGQIDQLLQDGLHFGCKFSVCRTVSLVHTINMATTHRLEPYP